MLEVKITIGQVSEKGGGMHLDLGDIKLSVQYNVRVVNKDTGGVLSDNATVPYGTKLGFDFIKHDYNDISWFSGGKIYDSPYGSFINGAAMPRDLCKVGSNEVAGRNSGGYNGYAHYTVDPPTKSIRGLGGVTCSDASNDGLNCTMDKAGTYTSNFVFNSTAGKFWVGVAEGKGNCAGSDNTSENVPLQSIHYRITVNPPPVQNNPPTTPTLSISSQGSGACVVGTPYTISMTATDSDNDQVRYLVDWDNDGTTDQIVPSSGYVDSGVAQQASRTFSTSGSKTMQVRAEDVKGSLSSWSPLTFSCANAPVSPPPPPPPPPPPSSSGQCGD